MALILDGFEGFNGFLGPKKSQFSGPTPSNAPRNDVAPLKTITYRAIKTTGTLIVITIFTYISVRHVTGNDKDYLRKIPRVVW